MELIILLLLIYSTIPISIKVILIFFVVLDILNKIQVSDKKESKDENEETSKTKESID